MVVLKWVLIAVVVLIVAAVLAGQLGLLQGKPPANLGVREGKLKPPAKTPNSVTSQAALYPEHPRRDFAQFAPLPLKGDGAATLARLQTIVQGMRGAQVIKTEPGYLYAQFTTPLMKFVDDTEFWVDAAAGVIQVRSASRVGKGDHGLNRARIEAIRAQLAAMP